jgi:hypothetical protein
MTYTTYYLEMQHPEQIHPKPLPAELSVIECERKR